MDCWTRSRRLRAMEERMTMKENEMRDELVEIQGRIGELDMK
jgi:hypothetical protein